MLALRFLSTTSTAWSYIGSFSPPPSPPVSYTHLKPVPPLAFADHSLAASHFPQGHVAAHSSPLPLGMEIALVTPDVASAHARALQAGAAEIKAPADQPWGQTVSYVRCPDGTLVELCTPIGV